jgi:3-dehydroquinate synthase
MSRTVRVELGARGYDINIGRNIDNILGVSGNGASVLLVSDSNVDPLYGGVCEEALRSRGFCVARAVIPAGECSKSLDQAKELFDHALASRLDRSSVVVALGGGVVGDLAGFIAATYLRGVKLLQLPTSLLAMVDSSVGGKTAVNLPQGKNLVGVFHQPIEVSIDLTTLSTLPEREYISGIAEIIKYGVIWDAELFAMLEKNIQPLLERDYDVLESVVARCCEIKAEVVGMDERESGVRAILNYGHTLGHAIENICGYGEFLHGEAIAIGMAYAGDVSSRTLGFDGSQRVKRLLADYGLPVGKSRLPDSVTWDALREAMSSDKKAQRAVPTFVLAKSIGAVEFGCDVSEDALRDCWELGAGTRG